MPVTPNSIVTPQTPWSATAVATTANTDAATKQYVDNTAFAMASGSLPGQGGNAGKALITDGTIPSWGIPTLTTSDITDYASDQAAKTATATKLAVAFAAAL